MNYFHNTLNNFLDWISNQLAPETEKAFSYRPLSRCETLEAREMLSVNGGGAGMEGDYAPFNAQDHVIVDGFTALINGQESYINANDGNLHLKVGDTIEIVSFDLDVQQGAANPHGVFAVEGYFNKISQPGGPSSADYNDGRFSLRESNADFAYGKLNQGGLDGSWTVEAGWDRLTLNVMHYFGDSSAVVANIAVSIQVGVPDFAFGEDIGTFAESTITVGQQVNINGSWLNQGGGLYHNYAEVDIFFENDSTPEWVGVLVGNASSSEAVSGEFLFPTENGNMFSERWTPTRAGTYYVEFTVEPEDHWYELNSENNRVLMEVVVQEPRHVQLDNDTIGAGIEGNKGDEGTGFIMYTEEAAQDRFQGIKNSAAANFVAVRNQDGQWQYNDGKKFKDFSFTSTDVLIASVDYSNDSYQLLQGHQGYHEGVQVGFLEGDPGFIANSWNGDSKSGQHEMTGTYINLFAV